MTTTAWATKYRRLSAKATAIPGRYNPELTPWVKFIHQALDDPTVHKLVGMKSAQIAWTDGVLNNYIGKRIHTDPCPMIVMFAKEGAAQEYNDEKFIPMVEVTPVLADILPVHKSRDKDNRVSFKQFPGGFLKFVGSNSASSVKSTPAPVVMVEEPDDCNTNINDQGDTITLLEERTKSFPRRKVIFGGTPTIDGLSRIQAAFLESDQRKFYVPCHHCGEAHVLDWQYVRWSSGPNQHHEVYKQALPDTAYYVCPHCGGMWNMLEKRRNVQKLYPVAHASFHGVAGFYVNELYSSFPGSSMQRLVEKYLAAQHALDQGDDTKMRAFRNSTEGLPYAYQSGLPDLKDLQDRAEHYQELTVPWGGLVITFGIDVQHDRIALVGRAWGRGEESWLIYWGEIHGQTIVPLQGAWVDLENFLFQEFKHASGAVLRVRAFSVDSSDGQSSDAVYSFVRRHIRRGAMAIKGSSTPDREIFSPPKVSADMDRKQKAHKYGLRPFIVGTERAKDLLLGVDAQAGRIKLTGSGPGRIHWYTGVRPDYWEQLTSEVKAPHRTVRNKKIWQKKSGVRNEALDCEVYCLHAARFLKLNLWKEDRWLDFENRMKQPDIFGETALPPTVNVEITHEDEGEDVQDQPVSGENQQETVRVLPEKPLIRPVSKPEKVNAPPKSGGFSATNW